jgi:hypothetical protein
MVVQFVRVAAAGLRKQQQQGPKPKAARDRLDWIGGAPPRAHPWGPVRGSLTRPGRAVHMEMSIHPCDLRQPCVRTCVLGVSLFHFRSSIIGSVVAQCALSKCLARFVRTLVGDISGKK